MIASLLSVVLLLGSAAAYPSPASGTSASSAAPAAPSVGILPAKKPSGDYESAPFRYIPSQLRVAGTNLCLTAETESFGSSVQLADCSEPRTNPNQLWGLSDSQRQFFLGGTGTKCLSENFPHPENVKLGYCDADDSDLWFFTASGELCVGAYGCISAPEVKAGAKLTVAEDPGKFLKVAYHQDIVLAPGNEAGPDDKWCSKDGACFIAAGPKPRATDAAGSKTE